MFEMFKNSASLFLRGKLFQDFGQVIRRGLIALIVGAAIAVPLALFAHWLAGAILGGLIGGALVPWLYKDLKYR